MRFEDMTPEMVEEAKKRETPEERLAFIQENGIELTDEQLESVAGGEFKPPWAKECLKNPESSDHSWRLTGRTKPGKIFGDLWTDKEIRCRWCGKTRWRKY